MLTARQKLFMKQASLLFLATGFLLVATWTLAQEKPSPTASITTATGSSNLVDDQKVKELKEKLATKVAELRENQKRGFFGEIAAASKTSFTLVTKQGEVKVRFSEDTKLFKIGKGKTEAKPDDVKNGTNAAVLGLFEEENKTHNAKVIFLQSTTGFTQGEIVEVDKTKATFTIKNDKGETQLLDYEKSTQAQEYTVSNKKISSSGLSRLAIGDKVEVWTTPDEEDSKKLNAVKILRIPKEVFEAKSETNEASPTPKASSTPSASSKPEASTRATPKPTTSPKASAAT